MIKVNFIFRNPDSGFHSIEEVFYNIQKYLQDVEIENTYLPKYGASPRSLISNLLFTRKHRNKINHITGDVHYIALGLKRRNTILTIHDIESLIQGSGLKRLLQKLIWLSLPVRKVAYVTVISEATKKKLLEIVSVNPEKIIVIPNSISSSFQYSPKEFNAKCPNILQVGATQNKNIERLCQALSGISCKLSILGRIDMGTKEILEKYSIAFDNYYSLSHLEVANLYKKCDFVSLISTFEGFGMPIIEAQAIGRPVITSNISSMPEVAGEGALLVDPFNVVDIRDKLIRLINNEQLRNDLIIKGLTNIEKYKPEQVAKRYIELYKKIRV